MRLLSGPPIGASSDRAVSASWVNQRVQQEFGLITAIGPILLDTSAGGYVFGMQQADATHDGFISASDWTRFNNAANASTITLTGDATGSGAGTINVTLADTGVTPGSYQKVTVDSKGRVTGASLLSSSDIANALGFTPVNKNGDTMTGLLILSGDPTVALGAATKQYVDNAVAGIDAKASVVVASNGSNIDLAAPGATINGVTMSAGNRFLAKDQTAPAENGIYVWNGAAVAATRSSDADVWTELISAYVWVEQGTGVADTGWYCSVDAGGTLDTTAVTWTQFSASSVITAGSGLTKSGSVISLTAVTANRVLVSDGAGILSASTVTSTTLGYLDATSSVQTQLNNKAPLASPTFTGTPAAPTAAADTNSTQLATTAFVVGQAASVAPANLGVAAVGSSLRYARQDHVHAFAATGPLSWNGTTISIAQATTSTDGYLSSADWNTFNGKAPLASPSFTGTPTAPTAAFNTNTTQLATTAFVIAQTKACIEAIATKSGAYTLTGTDATILCDATAAPFTVTLPAAPVTGQMYNIKKIDSSSNAVTISGNGKNIDGAASVALAAQWQSWTLQYDGTAWYAL